MTERGHGHGRGRTLDPAATVSAPYDYQRYDPSIDRMVSFRPATMVADLGRLHRWLNSEHVLPYWRLNHSLPRFRAALDEKLADDHLTPYVGSLDHVPMSYFERYWAADDPLAAHYDAEPADQGIHLLIGPPEYLGHGYAPALLRAMTALAFRHPETDRVVAEPDARNERAIRVFERCGYEPVREFEFPEEEKTALLVVCERDRFESTVESADEPEVDAEVDPR
ncbi:GNAT family N-acetyltransferase [Haloprofundus salinisoli]|uniref:GNAT family N-acetyltransferase n=1 Tax=Haloprofundus salinisoli TaxID=2876193 RepID=UPI001CCA183A|nr:GNAT family N-acetyltransferase [Haloprofundus salinisoli]